MNLTLNDRNRLGIIAAALRAGAVPRYHYVFAAFLYDLIARIDAHECNPGPAWRVATCDFCGEQEKQCRDYLCEEGESWTFCKECIAAPVADPRATVPQAIASDGRRRAAGGSDQEKQDARWSAPPEAIDAAWRAIEKLDGHPTVHRNVVALAVSAAWVAASPGQKNPVPRPESETERA